MRADCLALVLFQSFTLQTCKTLLPLHTIKLYGFPFTSAITTVASCLAKQTLLGVLEQTNYRASLFLKRRDVKSIINHGA